MTFSFLDDIWDVYPPSIAFIIVEWDIFERIIHY